MEPQGSGDIIPQEEETDVDILKRYFGTSVDVQSDEELSLFKLLSICSSVDRSELPEDEHTLDAIWVRAHFRQLACLASNVLGPYTDHFIHNNDANEVTYLPLLVRPADIWHLLCISATGIMEKVEERLSELGQTVVPSVSCPMSEPNWVELPPHITFNALRSAVECWMMTISKTCSELCQHEQSNVNCQEFCKEFDELLQTLSMRNRSSAESRLDAIFDYFENVAALIDDSANVLEDEAADLATLRRSPSRHTVLREILANNRPLKRLPTAFRALVNPTPEDERQCTICTDVWSPVPELQSSDATAGTWLAPSASNSELDIKSGCERVPVRLPCGHSFCAKCVKKWMGDGKSKARHCPYRDMDLGVWRRVFSRWRSLAGSME
jgi:hypothetical protein